MIDADVWGFSIPRMLGIDRPPVVIDSMLVPPDVHGVRCISMGFFAADDQAVIWRGPMLHKALEQFLTDVYWDDPDYLLVDLPAGHRRHRDLARPVPSSGRGLRRDHPAARGPAGRPAGGLRWPRRSTSTSRASSRTCPGSPATTASATRSSATAAARSSPSKLGVPLLGKVPLLPALRAGADIGRPIVVEEPDSEAAQVFAAIAEQIDTELAPTRRSHPELKLI